MTKNIVRLGSGHTNAHIVQRRERHAGASSLVAIKPMRTLSDRLNTGDGKALLEYRPFKIHAH